MTTSISITALTDIGTNISYTTLVPVVNMTGTPETQKANLQIVGNLILENAGGSYFAPAYQAILAQSVVNAAQPNITSIGTLATLNVTGNVNFGNISTGNIDSTGQVSSVDVSALNVVVAQTLTVPVYTVAGALTITGNAGSVIAISDSPLVHGRLAFWDTTNMLWAYVSDNTTV